MDLEHRHRIEQEFFDRQAAVERDADLCMNRFVPRYRHPSPEPIFPKEHLFHQMLPLEGKLVLDYGCGNGENSVLLAKCGAQVEGFDLSSEMCRVATERAEVNGVASSVTISCRSGEHTGYPDHRFDIVFGCAILHHLDMQLACREIRRLLKPGGVALFAEPVAFSGSYRWIKRQIRRVLPAPVHITETERQLTQEDFRVLSAHFERVDCTCFGLLDRALGIRPLIRFEPAVARLDYRLLRTFPTLQRYCSYVTIRASEPRQGVCRSGSSRGRSSRAWPSWPSHSPMRRSPQSLLLKRLLDRKAYEGTPHCLSSKHAA